jgi:hypothetical protein
MDFSDRQGEKLPAFGAKAGSEEVGEKVISCQFSVVSF